MRRLRFLMGFLLVGVAGFAVALGATGISGATSVRPTVAASVSRIVDGDTVVVRYKGRSDKVRILGIDTPERGRCYASAATAETRKLSLGKHVRLVGDASQAARDRYGRMLAYVMAPKGDVGALLVRGGFAHVYVYGGKPFARVTAYRRAEGSARSAARGLWSACGAVVIPTSTATGTTTPATTTKGSTTTTATTTTRATTTTVGTTTASTTTTATTTTTPTTTTVATTTTTSSKCDPSYPTVCIPPPPPDLNCGDIPYRNFTVLPPDPHHFDGNKDGVGCECRPSPHQDWEHAAPWPGGDKSRCRAPLVEQ